MISVKIMQGTQNIWVPFFYAKLGGAIMDEKKRSAEKKESIWKNEHVPMSKRTTSSGLTFRCRRKGDGENVGKKY